MRRQEADTNFFAHILLDSSEEKHRKERNLMKNQNANAKYSLMSSFVKKFDLNITTRQTLFLLLSLVMNLRILKVETIRMKSFVKSCKKQKRDSRREYRLSQLRICHC